MRRALAIASVLLLAATGCRGDDLGAEGTSSAPSDSPSASTDTEPRDPDAPEAPAPSPDGTDDEPLVEPEPEPPTPEPDPVALEDPCAGHEDRTDDGFIEVVAPVDAQRVGDQVELVGCANVFEGTVAYRLDDDAGTTFSEGFTTAECGSGCVGSFRETLDLTVAGDTPVVFIRVYSPNMDDAGPAELYRVSRVVIRE